jgi:PDDEXK-like domain of unknown function (DUF3799)
MTAPTAPGAPLTITEPGVYDGIPNDVYQADPVPSESLSSSGARRILPPSCPALFRYELDHGGRASTPAQEFGSAAHRLLLGDGPELYVYEPFDGRTKVGKDEALKLAEARAAGLTPISTADHARAVAMVEELRKHKLAAALFDPEIGKAEQSAFWIDRETGAWCRCRYDFLPEASGGRLIFPDYKTTDRLDDESIRKDIAKWRYHQQLDFYERGAQALGLAQLVTGVLVFQMRTAPYLVRVVQPDAEARELAHARNRYAIDLYARCKAADEWPGYGDDVHTASLPTWAIFQDQENLS